MLKRKNPKLDEEFERYGIDYYPEKKGFFTTLIQFLLVVLLMMVIALLGLYGYNYVKTSMKPTPTISVKTPTVVPTPVAMPTQQKQTQKPKTPTSLSSVVSQLLQSASDDSENTSYVKNLTAGNIDSVQEQKSVPPKPVDSQAIIINETVQTNTNQIFFDPSEEAHMDRVAQLALQIKAMIENNQVTNNAIPTNLIHDAINTNSHSDYTQALTQEVHVREREMTSIIVKRGESLAMIAQRVYGDANKFQTILDANPQLKGDSTRIFIGQRLRTPQ